VVTWAFTMTTFCLWVLASTITSCAYVDAVQLMQSTLRDHLRKPERMHATWTGTHGFNRQITDTACVSCNRNPDWAARKGARSISCKSILPSTETGK